MISTRDGSLVVSTNNVTASLRKRRKDEENDGGRVIMMSDAIMVVFELLQVIQNIVLFPQIRLKEEETDDEVGYIEISDATLHGGIELWRDHLLLEISTDEEKMMRVG